LEKPIIFKGLPAGIKPGKQAAKTSAGRAATGTFVIG